MRSHYCHLKRGLELEKNGINQGGVIEARIFAGDAPYARLPKAFGGRAKKSASTNGCKASQCVQMRAYEWFPLFQLLAELLFQ